MAQHGTHIPVLPFTGLFCQADNNRAGHGSLVIKRVSLPVHHAGCLSQEKNLDHLDRQPERPCRPQVDQQVLLLVCHAWLDRQQTQRNDHQQREQGSQDRHDLHGTEIHQSNRHATSHGQQNRQHECHGKGPSIRREPGFLDPKLGHVSGHSLHPFFRQPVNLADRPGITKRPGGLVFHAMHLFPCSPVL
ncbi:MAG: hypothetical protein CMJ73_03645 [Planctomycetaceae bacterium]|nr:hypothetical protein [Planctomycetaceae bacterium]